MGMIADRLTVEIIDREDALGPILDRWRRLAAARGNAFITPEWYMAALHGPLHDEASPVVALVRDGGTLRGLLPLLASHSKGPRQLLSFPATGFADWFHPVAPHDGDEAVAAAAAP